MPRSDARIRSGDIAHSNRTNPVFHSDSPLGLHDHQEAHDGRPLLRGIASDLALPSGTEHLKDYDWIRSNRLQGADLKALRRALPQPVRAILKSLYVRALDLTDISTRRREMIPPRALNFVGGSNYRGVGLEFRELFVRYGGLKPNDRVLDVGSGIGRMAAPLTSYLAPSGEYRGFDIVKKGVAWSQEHITPRYPNFCFIHADIKNRFYNPDGVYEASSYKFPYGDGGFDFVFLTSVFTHMFPTDMENYLREISRVLKQGGTCFITMFLLNEESQQLIEKGSSTQNFVYKLKGCVTADANNPEASLAFEESYVRDLFAASDLSIREPIHRGAWCGRKEYLSYQDIVIATKL